jgi:HEAT repeats
LIRRTSPVEAIDRARGGLRQAAVRRQLRAVAAGKTVQLSMSSADLRSHAPKAVEQIAAGLREDSLPVQLLQVAFKNSKAADEAVEHLSAKSVPDKVAGARLVGALMMYEAVPWLGPLLTARDHSVADAAARALGKIGGVRSAAALVRAIQRKGPNRRLVSELARGAPDLFIEARLGETESQTVRPALALAAGLRRRHTAISPLIELLQHGNRRERVISCRALGWIGAANAVPLIYEALGDPDWKIRISAAKSLGAMRTASSWVALVDLSGDTNPKVRKTARQTLRWLARGA